MKLLLISPNNPYNIFRVPEMFKIAGKLSPWMQVGARAAFPGLNLAIIAAITPPDIEVQIIDESVEPVDFDTDADRFQSEKHFAAAVTPFRRAVPSPFCQDASPVNDGEKPGIERG